MADAGDLDFLLNFDGAVFAFEAGYWIKIKARRIKANPVRPYGLNYSLTLHEPGGGRILGFDNAHVVAEPGRSSKRSPSGTITGIERKTIRAGHTNTWMRPRSLRTSSAKRSAS